MRDEKEFSKSSRAEGRRQKRRRSTIKLQPPPPPHCYHNIIDYSNNNPATNRQVTNGKHLLKLNMKAIITTIILTTTITLLHAFTTSSPQKRSFILSSQQPNFGDWTNDDYLNNLSGDSQYNEEYNENYAENEYNTNEPPQNSLTDEEITAWALNAAQFYNTDASVAEVYGMKREGPPRREEGTEVDGW